MLFDSRIYLACYTCTQLTLMSHGLFLKLNHDSQLGKTKAFNSINTCRTNIKHNRLRTSEVDNIDM